jgi:hypothetical protein
VKMTRLQSVNNIPPELATHLTLQSDPPDSAVDETTESEDD